MALGVARAQSTTGVFPVQATNLQPGEVDAIGSLIAIAYSAYSGMQVASPAETGRALTERGSEVDAARQLGLTQYISVTAIRLGARIALHASLRAQDGSERYAVRVTATSIDDMEPVADRIAASLYTQTPLEETRTRHNVTGIETRRSNRMFSEKVFGFRSGVTWPMGRHVDPRASIDLEFDCRLDADAYFLEFAGGFLIPSSDRGASTISGLTLMIGGSYYLTEDDIAPYIGAGLSPRIMSGGVDGAGLAVRLQLGLMLMRWSSSRLYGELGVDQHLIGISSYEYGTTSSWSHVWPTELSFRVGVGW
jgi:hypothetical protein